MPLRHRRAAERAESARSTRRRRRQVALVDAAGPKPQTRFVRTRAPPQDPVPPRTPVPPGPRLRPGPRVPPRTGRPGPRARAGPSHGPDTYRADRDTTRTPGTAPRRALDSGRRRISPRSTGRGRSGAHLSVRLRACAEASGRRSTRVPRPGRACPRQAEPREATPDHGPAHPGPRIDPAPASTPAPESAPAPA